MSPSIRIRTRIVGVVVLSIYGVTGVCAERTAERVTLVVMDAFGSPGTDCRVTEFVVDNETTHRQLSKTGLTTQPNLAERFDGVIGRKIPFGAYIADVKCSSPRGAGGRFFPTIDRADAVVVVTHFAYDGDDYFLFKQPLLNITVRSKDRLQNPIWVKIVGSYSDTIETALVDVASGRAGFYHLGLGTYFVYVFQANKIVCHQQIDLLERGATIILTSQGADRCAVDQTSGAKVTSP